MQRTLSRRAVFQAAGPTSDAIQGTVDAFRVALGDPNNANTPGPLATGRREINWDGGGGVDVTTDPVTPFNVFLNSRGGRFTTLGTGLSQAPPSGGPQDGLAGLFSNPTYGTIFSAFSPLRLFTPVGSNLTEAWFFVPGTNGDDPATVRGFGAVFTDVDEPDGLDRASSAGPARGWSTSTSTASCSSAGSSRPRPAMGACPSSASCLTTRASPGSGSPPATVAPGPDDDETHDIVMMDDFFYGEPHRAEQDQGSDALPSCRCVGSQGHCDGVIAAQRSEHNDPDRHGWKNADSPALEVRTISKTRNHFIHGASLQHYLLIPPPSHALFCCYAQALDATGR